MAFRRRGLAVLVLINLPFCLIGSIAAIVLAGGLYAFMLYANAMDVYEKGILIAAIPSAIALGWFWRPLRVLMLSVAASEGMRQTSNCSSFMRLSAALGTISGPGVEDPVR